MLKPDKSEYASYYETYFSEIPEGNILELYEKQINEVKEFFGGISSSKLNFRYAKGKWTVKEILGHIIDTERIFAVRALCFSRNESQALPGFDENEYVSSSNFGDQTIASLLNQFELGRKSALEMFRSFNDEMWLRKGTASNNIMSVRAVPFIIAGHASHHIRMIKERYL